MKRRSAILVFMLFGFSSPPAFSAAITMGEKNALSTADNNNANVVVAQSASLTQSAKILSLSLDVSKATSSLNLGIYDSSGPGGGPGNLLATTGTFAASKGWNTKPVSSQVELKAGTYWLAYSASSNNLTTLAAAGSGSRGVYYSRSFGALPSKFSASPSTSSWHWSFYANLETTAATAVNGVCGSANGVASAVIPTANLCSAGTASSVSGQGPFLWACIGANGGTTAACSAPLASTGQNFALGQRPFSAAASWNTPIPSGAVYTNIAWPASTGYNYSVSWDSYSAAIYVSLPSDPIVQVSYPAGWGYPGGTLNIRMPADADGAPGTDGELLVIDGSKVHNFWIFKRTGLNTATAQSYGAADILSGTGWGSKSPFLSAGITAAGSSQMAGILVQAETDAGEIKHALNIRGEMSLVKAGAYGQAISSDGSSPSGILQEGKRYAIPRSTPMPAGLSPLGQKVFRAMQSYGAYVTDVAGGVTTLGVQQNAYDDPTMTALWHDAGAIVPLLKEVNTP